MCNYEKENIILWTYEMRGIGEHVTTGKISSRWDEDRVYQTANCAADSGMEEYPQYIWSRALWTTICGKPWIIRWSRALWTKIVSSHGCYGPRFVLSHGCLCWWRALWTKICHVMDVCIDPGHYGPSCVSSHGCLRWSRALWTKICVKPWIFTVVQSISFLRNEQGFLVACEWQRKGLLKND